MTRTKTAREILDEYERLAKEREERRFNQITNPNVRFVFLNYIFLNISIQSIGFSTYNNKSN
jgi:hypothetical protein